MTETNESSRPIPELGKIEQVDVRGIWKHEALNFTPWLARHLDLLGDALGMELDLVQREAAVGPFSLDILAQNRVTGEKVAIENQLAWTDHTHLGQILVYAAGHDARAVIWVAPHFQEEHRAAIDWLNKWTPEEIAFFGVEVSAIKIGESLPAPVFRPVAFPNDWSKQAQRKTAASSPDHEKQLQFFVPLSERLVRERVVEQVRKERGLPCVVPSGIPYCNYGIERYRERVSVYLWINAGNGESTNRIFDALKVDSTAIQAGIEAKWVWERYGNHAWARVRIDTPGSLDDPPEKVAEDQSWVVKNLPKFIDALNPRLEPVVGELQNERSAPPEADAPEADPDA